VPITILVQGFVIFVCFQLSTAIVWADDTCTEGIARLVSIQGVAEFVREGKTNWNIAQMGQMFCPGDRLRVNENARAAVVLNNDTILRVNQKSTINFGKESSERFFLLNLLEGMLHIFSHRPRSLQVNTPHINGAVEGTEFMVETGTDSSIITVFEGLVSAANKQGRVELSSGQAARAQRDSAPQYMTVVRPREAVQWTLYYPTIFDASRQTDGDETEKLLRKASVSLSRGQVMQARAFISRILQTDATNSDGTALLAIIAVVNNKRELAFNLASQALQAAPRSSAAGLALSYAQQARFDIEGALTTLQKTASDHPENGEVKARLSEMLLSVGQSNKGLTAAQEAVALAPGSGRALTVLGFALLTRTEIEQAEQTFKQAIALDPILPMARLGLGLALIRSGRLAEGRAEIEIAAALNPGKSLIRSYLGKAYFDEKRNAQSRRQYDIARQLDPADPTPWFYDAIRKQTINRPVEALYDLRQSIERNDNRAVYRSRLLLDADLAARSANLASIYSDLGFQQRAVVEGLKSVNTDPANYSAHRFLADSYLTLPRHEIARVSELFQSQLLQPLNVTPVQPQLAESNLFIQEGAGPTLSSFNEFNPLFLRNRIAFQASGVAGSNAILGDEITLSGVQDKFSYSLGQFYYQSDGVRENNDQQQHIYNVFLQGMLSTETSLMAEVRYRDDSYGDLNRGFDSTDFSTIIRQDDETKSFRIGVRHDLQPRSTLLGTAIFGSNDSRATDAGYFPLFVDISRETDNIMVEAQHLYKGNTYNLQTGGGVLSADESEIIELTSPFQSVEQDEGRAHYVNIYGYGVIELPCDLTTTLGLSGDLVDSPLRDKNSLNPKLGLTWQPIERTVLRAAVFRILTRDILYSQTIEPTQVAGFNQFFDDFDTTTSWTYGIALDQEFSESWYGGLQLFHRDLEVPFANIDFTGAQTLIEDDWQEDIGSAYLYWAAHNWITLGLDYYYEDFSHEDFGGPMEILNLTTHRLTPKLFFFHPSGISARIQASYIDQEGDFLSGPFGTTPGSDQFWVADLSLSYRLPKRYGILSLDVQNLFDEKFNFLDIDPGNPRYLPEQQAIVRFTVAF